MFTLKLKEGGSWLCHKITKITRVKEITRALEPPLVNYSGTLNHYQAIEMFTVT
jgi:hypothetical protein